MIVSGKQLYLSVKTAIRTLKGRRRDQAAFFVAALFFSVGFALGKLLADKWITRLQIAMYAIGVIAFVYGAVRIWRLVNPPELPPAKDRPSAIKGPMAFTEADGDLFRKLERETELQKLLGFVLDNQILMFVVRGASGAGKTSLLRAGLKHILGDRAVFHYWEAVPVEPDKGLLRALQESWPEGVAKPATLAELVNPSDTLGRRSHVIVLDQFEQLRGNRKIFQLLRRIIRESKPPHRITWVIAFRREFTADWIDFISPEQENGFRPPPDISLRLFSAEQAREVIGQLINESDLKDSIEQSVIDNLVEAATVDGEVSPVDIGIGLLVLTELHERQSSQTITKRDYQFAGGAEGLLTQYISRCLESFPKESQEAILKAMLALRDPEENRQRLATGLTIDELAVEAETDARVLKTQLNRLADRDIRLLEADTPPDGSAMRYRLPHERLIPALYRLTGKLLAEVDQAKLKFQNAFQAWQTNDKRSRYLLKGKELRLVQHYETQIPWGHDEQEKKSFLFRSKRRRQFVRAAIVAAVLVLIGASWFSILQYQQFEGRRYLTESGYPAELYDFQHQLKKLEMTEPLNLEHFTWLSSDSIEELSLTAASSSNSIAGLTSLSRCRSLKKLTLNLSNSQVSDLKSLEQLQGLTQLTLHISESQMTDLKPLTKLRNLTQLTLGPTKGNSWDLLAQLSNLTHLTLGLRASKARDLEPLARLRKLTQLSLDLSYSEDDFLEPLSQLNNLEQLSLELSEMPNLSPLARLSNLTQLSLNFGSSQVADLTPLAQLNTLTQLSLYIGTERVTNLPSLQPLAQLRNFRRLSLDLGGSRVTDLTPLAQLSTLRQLSVKLNSSRLSNLEPLAQLRTLTQLSLDFGTSEACDLKPLEQLKDLTRLTLNASQRCNLEVLSKLGSLTQLTLDFSNSPTSDLKALEQIKGLKQLTLDLSSTTFLNPSSGRWSELKPLEQLNGLTQLTLDLRGSEVSNLDSLTKLNGLMHVALILRDRKESVFEILTSRDSLVSDLAPMAQLTSLQTLSIETATRAQRMSLQSIPASLVELTF